MNSLSKSWIALLIHLYKSFPVLYGNNLKLKEVRSTYCARFNLDYGVNGSPSTNILLSEFAGHCSYDPSSPLAGCK